MIGNSQGGTAASEYAQRSSQVKACGRRLPCVAQQTVDAEGHETGGVAVASGAASLRRHCIYRPQPASASLIVERSHVLRR